MCSFAFAFNAFAVCQIWAYTCMRIVIKEHRQTLVTCNKTTPIGAQHFDAHHNFDIDVYRTFHKLEPKIYSQNVVLYSINKANLQTKKHMPIPEVYQLLCNVICYEILFIIILVIDMFLVYIVNYLSTFLLFTYI